MEFGGNNTLQMRIVVVRRAGRFLAMHVLSSQSDAVYIHTYIYIYKICIYTYKYISEVVSALSDPAAHSCATTHLQKRKSWPTHDSLDMSPSHPDLSIYIYIMKSCYKHASTKRVVLSGGSDLSTRYTRGWHIQGKVFTSLQTPSVPLSPAPLLCACATQEAGTSRAKSLYTSLYICIRVCTYTCTLPRALQTGLVSPPPHCCLIYTPPAGAFPVRNPRETEVFFALRALAGHSLICYTAHALPGPRHGILES